MCEWAKWNRLNIGDYSRTQFQFDYFKSFEKSVMTFLLWDMSDI